MGPGHAHLRGLCVAILAAALTVLAVPDSALAASAGTLTGTVVTKNGGDFTVEQAGSGGGKINAMVAFADRFAAKKYPYVYGGGHGRPGVPTVGTSGKGAKGFDCSGVVAAVLASAGIWPASEAVPGDAAVITDLLKAGKIAKGAGVGPDSVDLFDRPGADIQMNIEGDFFGTGYTRNGGPAWMGDLDVSYPGYKEYHVLPSVLADSSSYRQLITFEYPDNEAGYKVFAELTVGAKVQVSYGQSDGVMYVHSATNIGGTPFKPVSAGF